MLMKFHGYAYGIWEHPIVHIHYEAQQVKLMWTPEALSLFMINRPYLDSLNDVEIYYALKNYSRL